MFKHITLISLVLLTACKLDAELVIDGSSQEAYQQSINAMRDTLPEAEKDIFARGLMNLIVTSHVGHDSKAAPFQMLAMLPQAIEAAPTTLDGTSLNAILKVGRGIVAKQAEEKAKKLAYVEADKKVRDCIASKVGVRHVNVFRGKYSQERLEFTIENNIGFALAGIRFKYTVSSPKRSVPWKTDTIALSIAGGIEPSEVKTLAVNLFGLPKGAFHGTVVTLKLLDVADAETRMLIGRPGVRGWSDEPSQHKCTAAPT